ncbi:hypothetical protein [Bacteroides sp.]|uniref:hypothetical protein n=1 Tax=Bacteroides sp. TaxID=29523 RepID=UPI002579A6BA|nr:hypothetical protein [Bacteroides sp.]
MKKIMFSDKYGLTKAVLEGRKTMTRRIIKCPRTFRGEWVAGFNIHRSPSDKKIVGFPCMYDADEREFDMGEILPKYKLGEVVAIAQSYRDSGYSPDSLDRHPKDLSVRGLMKDSAGWNNKMFVKSYACRHHIKIVNVKIERLQDISDEDCLKEGVIHAYTDNNGIKIYHTPHTKRGYLSTDVAQQAFSFLIDKVSGKGTWESNPFVFAYEFVLVD